VDRSCAFLAGQTLEVAERMVDRIGIIADGRLIAEGIMS
jgi:ABC-type multidrug transport system ATPase subunit